MTMKVSTVRAVLAGGLLALAALGCHHPRHVDEATIAKLKEKVPRKARVSVRNVPDPEAQAFADQIYAYMSGNGWLSVGRLTGNGAGLPPITEPLQIRPTTFPVVGIEVAVGHQ